MKTTQDILSKRFTIQSKVRFIGRDNPKGWPTDEEIVVTIQSTEHMTSIWKDARVDSRECKYTVYRTFEELKRDFEVVTTLKSSR